MKSYRVFGFDRTTGKKREVTVRAASEREAVSKASAEGVFASGVKAMREAPGPPPLPKPIHEWRVKGALAATGVNTVLTIRAPDAESAQAIAQARGLFVAEIEQVTSRPMHLAGSRPGAPILTERTSKKWKGIMLAGVICSLGGFASCSGYLVAGTEDTAIVGALGMLAVPAGIVLFLVGLIGGWWNHG